jgi:hypothetical protein
MPTTHAGAAIPLSMSERFICFRFLHIIGTTLVVVALLCFALLRVIVPLHSHTHMPLFLFSLLPFSILTSSIQDNRFLYAAPIFGYGFAWVGHFFFEKNRPATFKQPFYSLMGDFMMWYDALPSSYR